MDTLENRAILLQKSELEEELVAAFFLKNYPGVVQFLTQDDQHLSLTPLRRSLLGLSLCLLCHYAPGLRELSLALELSPFEDGISRVISMVFLYVGLETTSQPTLAATVYKEIVKEDSFGVLNSFESREIENEQLMPLFETAKLNLSTKTLKSQLFLNNSMLHINVSRFKKVYGGHNGDKAISYLQEIFDMVISVAPLENFDKFRVIQEAVQEIELVSEFHYSKSMANGAKLDARGLDALRNVIITKTLSAFLLLHTQKYKDSHYKFAWILKQFAKVSEAYPKSYLGEIGLTEGVFKSVSLLLSKALINSHNILEKSTNIHECLAQVIALTEEDEVTANNSHYALDFFFAVMGLLYLENSVYNSSSIGSNSILLNKADVEESIRKMIILSTLKAVDDSSVVDVYKVILSELALFGNVSLKIIWFFNYLKDYFHIRTSVNDSVSLMSFLSPLAKKIAAATQPCLEELIAYEEKFNKTPEECKDLSVPLVQIDKLDNEGKLITVQLLKSNKAISFTEEEKLAKSQELLDLWVMSYEQNQGDIPIEIQNYMAI